MHDTYQEEDYSGQKSIPMIAWNRNDKKAILYHYIQQTREYMECEAHARQQGHTELRGLSID